MKNTSIENETQESPAALAGRIYHTSTLACRVPLLLSYKDLVLLAALSLP